MAILKRATKIIQDAGIRLEIHKGLYGPYLYNPRLKRQRGKVYKDADAAISAALRGEKPEPDFKYRVDGWPLCPACGEDELWSPLVWEDVRPTIEAFIAAGLCCYRCNWEQEGCDGKDTKNHAAAVRTLPVQP